jgi:hypothetical protein
MKTNGTYEVIARTAGPGLVLAAVFALVISGSSVGRAQARATSPAVPAAGSAQAAPSAQAEQPVSPGKRQPGGTHESIKVHGHWMIEVKSPDGKVVSHTEFENSLYGSGGAQILPYLFTGTALSAAAYTPGEWGVLLGDPKSSPCTAGLSLPFNNVGITTGPILAFTSGGFCVLAQLAPPAAIYPVNCSPAPDSGCSYNLQTGNNNAGGFTLTGSVVSANAGTISQVQTLLSTCGANIAPAACPKETSPDTLAYEGGDLVLAFTSASLPSSSSGATPCGGAGQISCAVNVPAAGDTINVSVTISFQ